MCIFLVKIGRPTVPKIGISMVGVKLSVFGSFDFGSVGSCNIHHITCTLFQIHRFWWHTCFRNTIALNSYAFVAVPPFATVPTSGIA